MYFGYLKKKKTFFVFFFILVYSHKKPFIIQPFIILHPFIILAPFITIRVTGYVPGACPGSGEGGVHHISPPYVIYLVLVPFSLVSKGFCKV